MRGTCITISLLLASCISSPPQTTPDFVDLRLEIPRCPVHNEPLLVDQQPVAWRTDQSDLSWYAMRDALFPCAFDDVHLHCKPEAELALVTYCAKCRFAKRKCTADLAMIDLWNIDVDAFIARQWREVENEYPKQP